MSTRGYEFMTGIYYFFVRVFVFVSLRLVFSILVCADLDVSHGPCVEMFV